MSKINPAYIARPVQPSLLKFATIVKHPLADLVADQNFVTWTRDYKRLWGILQPHRLPFKSFIFWKLFQQFTPLPYKTHGNFFRTESRVFIYWYKFHLRKYCLLLDLGGKQKKFVSESAIWLRQGRRDAPIFFSFWMRFRGQNSFFSRTANQSFLSLNSNLINPFFSYNLSSKALYWFEEFLPILRLFGWNFYNRATPLSLPVYLTQSNFDQKALKRKAKEIFPSMLWLASPIQISSALISSFVDNPQVIFPEWFFQFKRNRQMTKKIWSQAFARLWFLNRKIFSVAKCLTSFDVFFSASAISSYLTNRLFNRFFSVLAPFSFRFKIITKSGQKLLVSKLFPSYLAQFNKWSRSPFFSFFSHSALFKRHLRRSFFKNFWTLSFIPILDHSSRDLNFFLAMLFQQYLFKQNSFVMNNQLFFLWAFILCEIECASWDHEYHYATTPINPIASFDSRVSDPFLILKEGSYLKKLHEPTKRKLFLLPNKPIEF